METDVDCGGSACSPCAKGRICAFDSDCGAVGGASATSPLIVCSTASRLCTDPRVGVQAYGPGTGNPPLRGIVSLNLTLGGVSPAGVTPTLISAVEAAVAAALTSLGLAQSSTAAYVIIVLAVRAPVTPRAATPSHALHDRFASRLCYLFASGASSVTVV